MDVIVNDNPMLLVNVYAPNQDDPEFFKSLIERISEFDVEIKILGGDLNILLDPDKDRKGGSKVRT